MLMQTLDGKASPKGLIPVTVNGLPLEVYLAAKEQADRRPTKG